jgi:hypothetical protein
MAQSFFGSIDYDKLVEALKTGQVKTFKTDNGKRLVNVNVWINDTEDQYGNIASISLSLKDEFKEEKKKVVYIGNMKKSTPSITEAAAEDFNDAGNEDLPF